MNIGRSRNLLILAVALIVIPLITVTASLLIYDLSGDKYLDLSRPGYMPEQSEQQEDPQSTPKFSDTGPINRAVLDSYLEQYKQLTLGLDSNTTYFSDAPLTDEALGMMPGIVTPEDAPEGAPAD